MPRGTPDILAVVRGFTIFLEVKLPGNKLTPMQAHQSREWRKAFAVVKTVYSLKEALYYIDELDVRARKMGLHNLFDTMMEKTYAKADNTQSDG